MRNLFLLLFFLFYFSKSFASAPFKPTILIGKEEPLCQIAQKQYSDAFFSKARLRPILKHPEFTPVQFEPSSWNDQINQHFMKTAIHLKNKKYMLLFQESSRGSWLEYKGHFDEYDKLLHLIHQDPKSLEQHVPFIEKKWSSDYADSDLNIFMYKDKLFLSREHGENFIDDDASYSIFEFQDRGQIKLICDIKTYPQNKPIEFLPFLMTYQRIADTILNYTGARTRGPSSPAYAARNNRNAYLKRIFMRPWSINLKESELYHKHLKEWRFGDVWSDRQYATLEISKQAALQELLLYYNKKMGYKSADALQYAKNAIDALTYAPYLGTISTPLYPNDMVNIQMLNKLVKGKFQDWDKLEKLSNVIHQPGSFELKIHPATFSLLIDTPRQLDFLPKRYAVSQIKSNYSKDLLMYASHMNNYDSVQYLLDNYPKEFNTSHLTGDIFSFIPSFMCHSFFYDLYPLSYSKRSALTYAAENASIPLIKLLIDHGFDTHIKDESGRPLDDYLTRNMHLTEAEKKLGIKGIAALQLTEEDYKPSFSCNKARTRIEKAICSSRGLAIYDQFLHAAYQQAMKDKTLQHILKADQVKWLQNRNKDCLSSENNEQLNTCIAKTTRSRTRYLRLLSEVKKDKNLFLK